MDTELAIIGAGPYGLSVASHAVAHGIPHVLLGDPMAFWRKAMPESMLVRSLARFTSLSHPATAFTLPTYLRSRSPGWKEGQPYPKQIFLDYVEHFQRQCGVRAEDRWVTRLTRQGRGFLVQCGEDELRARHVVVATGLTPFVNVPSVLAQSLPAHRHSHSSQLGALSRLANRRVAVIGGGQSAYETALLASEAGANVTIARRSSGVTVTGVHNRYSRSFMTALCKSSSAFYRLPQSLRDPLRKRMLPTTLAPWVLSELSDASVSVWHDAQLQRVRDGQSSATLEFSDGRALEVDHVIAATGYRVDLQRIEFLDSRLRAAIRTHDKAPILDRHYESSVPGLFFSGAMAMHSHGPAFAFVCGVYPQCKAMVDVRLRRSAAQVCVDRSRIAVPASVPPAFSPIVSAPLKD